VSDRPGPEHEQDLRLPSPEELVLSTAQLAISLAAEGVSRPDQLQGAQLAIDTADALLPLVGRLVSPEQLRQYRRAVAELQLAYAQAAGTTPPAGEQEPPGGPPPPAPPQRRPEPPPPRERPRPSIWTPRGEV
jgi:hypothetical protein